MVKCCPCWQLKCHWARGPATPCLGTYWLRSGSNDGVTRRPKEPEVDGKSARAFKEVSFKHGFPPIQSVHQRKIAINWGCAHQMFFETKPSPNGTSVANRLFSASNLGEKG